MAATLSTSELRRRRVLNLTGGGIAETVDDTGEDLFSANDDNNISQTTQPPPEEERTCRICYRSAEEDDLEPRVAPPPLLNHLARLFNVNLDQHYDTLYNPILISPCRCKGTQEFVHLTCLNSWRAISDNSQNFCPTCQYEFKTERTKFATTITSPTFINVVAVLCLFISFLITGSVFRKVNHAVAPTREFGWWLFQNTMLHSEQIRIFQSCNWLENTVGPAITKYLTSFCASFCVGGALICGFFFTCNIMRVYQLNLFWRQILRGELHAEHGKSVMLLCAWILGMQSGSFFRISFIVGSIMSYSECKKFLQVTAKKACQTFGEIILQATEAGD